MCGFMLVCLAVLATPPPGCALQPDDLVAREGRAELQRLRGFAAQPRYGACWSLALEKIQTSCREFNEETQSELALAFTHCHLRRSDRPFPECPAGSGVRECTRDMDAAAFGTYTEFFTHAHSICHYLQSERWQGQAENTMHRLTESSADVAEQLVSTRRVAEDLAQVQSAALKTQEAILRNGEELKHALHDSAQGVREVFSEIQDTAREQQEAFSAIFSRVAYLQGFVMSESHTLSSLLYNALGLCAALLVTATRRTAGARLVLFGLVAVNVYLERTICRTVLDSTDPGYLQMERIALLVGLLRRAMVLLGLLALAYSALRYRDTRLESLEVLAKLKETQADLHLALQRAESLTEAADKVQRMMGRVGRVKEESWRTREEIGALDSTAHELSVILPAAGLSNALSVSRRPSLCDSQEETLTDAAGMVQRMMGRMGTAKEESWRTREETGALDSTAHELSVILPVTGRSKALSASRRSSISDSPHARHGDGDSVLTRGAMETQRRRSRRRSSALVYSVLVEDSPPRYNLRSQRSLSGGASLLEIHTPDATLAPESTLVASRRR